MPDPPEVIVIHEALLVAVHEHVGPAVTLTLLLAPEAAGEALPGDMEYVQELVVVALTVGVKLELPREL